VFNLDKAREALTGSWICDSGKAHDELGFTPEPLTRRLRETADWYRSRGWL
jgi:nucleoside-diphosphate-sugar epimerase